MQRQRLPGDVHRVRAAVIMGRAWCGGGVGGAVAVVTGELWWWQCGFVRLCALATQTGVFQHHPETGVFQHHPPTPQTGVSQHHQPLGSVRRMHVCNQQQQSSLCEQQQQQQQSRLQLWALSCGWEAEMQSQ